MSNKHIPALACALLVLSSSAFAQEWTQEERAAGLKIHEVTRHVPAGKERTLTTFAFLLPDCTQTNTETIITKPPEYGRAVIETKEGFPTYPKENVRRKSIGGLAMSHKC
jgi:hypothetical protein